MIKLLVKNRLRSFVGSLIGKGRGGTVKKVSVGKIIGFSLLYLYVIAAFLFLSTTMAISLGTALIQSGASWLYFAIFMLISVTVIFIFSIFETKSELFECKDNDLLLSMPIKPHSIVASRTFVVLLYNYIEEAIIMLPCIVVYAVIAKDIVGVIGATLISLFLPLIATALASAVGYFVALISKRFHKNSFATVIIALLFLFVYFWGYDKLLGSIEGLITDTGIVFLPSDMPIIYHIGAAALLKPLNALAVIAVCVGSAALAYYLISKNYINVITDNRGAKRAEYKGEFIKSKSALSALTRKEIGRFISSANYMLNAGLGLVFEIVISVVALVNKSKISDLISTLTAEGMKSPESFFAPIIAAGLVLMSSMNMMSASAMSLEGKSLWMIKTIPVRDRDVLLSKVLPQIIISVPPTLISSVLLIIAFGAPAKFWAFFILTPIIANVCFAFFGLIMNIALPKFDFENEAQVIKQSLATFLVMLTQMVVGILAIAINFILALTSLYVLSAFITLIFFIILTVICVFILLGPSARRYAKFEA